MVAVGGPAERGRRTGGGSLCGVAGGVVGALGGGVEGCGRRRRQKRRQCWLRRRLRPRWGGGVAGGMAAAQSEGRGGDGRCGAAPYHPFFYYLERLQLNIVCQHQRVRHVEVSIKEDVAEKPYNPTIVMLARDTLPVALGRTGLFSGV